MNIKLQSKAKFICFVQAALLAQVHNAVPSISLYLIIKLRLSHIGVAYRQC